MSDHAPCTSCSSCTTGTGTPLRGLSRRRALAGVVAAGLGASVLAACSSGGGEEAAKGGSGMTGPLGPASEVPVGSGKIYADAGVVVTQPAEGEFKAFSATCTHQGCLVDSVSETIDCGCHGSQFSIEDGSAVEGPAVDPLGGVPVAVEGDQVVLG